MTLVTRMEHLPHSVHYSSLILYRCLQLELAEMEEGDVLLGTVSIPVPTSPLMYNHRTTQCLHVRCCRHIMDSC